MLLRFTPVPSSMLPKGVDATVIEGDLEAVYQVCFEGRTPEQICEALTEVTSAYASQSWMHVGALEFDTQRVVE